MHTKLSRGCCAALLLLIVSLGVTYVHTADNAAKTDAAIDIQTLSEEELREILAVAPDRADVLEQMAQILLERGDVRNADEMYSHLLNLSLTDSSLAFRFAVAKWHLLQEYEAHAALIAAARGGVSSEADAASADAALQDVYNAGGFAKMLQAVLPGAENAGKIEEMTALWQTVMNPAGTGTGDIALKTVPTIRNHPARAFLALWLGFMHMNQGDHNLARRDFKTALEMAPDTQTAFNARTGIQLLTGLQSHADYRELINAPFNVADNMPGAARDQSNAGGMIDSLLAQLEDAARQGNMVWATDLSRNLHYYRMDEGQRGRNLYLLGELWNNTEITDRAVQSYQAAQITSHEDYLVSNARFRLANIALKRGDRENAMKYAKLAAASAPANPWRQREVGDFFFSLGMNREGVAYYEASIPASTTPETIHESYSALMALYNRMGDRNNYIAASEKYAAALDELGVAADPNQQGLAWLFRAENFTTERKPDKAQEAYLKASELLTDVNARADVFQKMADYEAEHGNPEKAAEYAEKSAETRPEDWVYRRSGDFLLRLDMPERALALYDRAAKIANPDDDASGLSYMADAYNVQGDVAHFVQSAGRYVSAVEAKGDKASDAERGLAAYYQGKILETEDKQDDAYLAFERSTEHLADTAKLADAYILMAEHDAARGRFAQAGVLADKSLALLPNEDWKIRQVADLYNRMQMRDKSESLIRETVDVVATPKQRAEAVREIAEFYRSNNDRKTYLQYAGEYRDLVAAPEFNPTPNEQGLAWYYRGEILAEAKDLEKAQQAYEEASRLLTDNVVLSDAFQKMAEYEALHGDKAKAAAYAEKSADVRPDDWVLRRTGDFLLGLNMPDRAYAYYDRSVKATHPLDDATAFSIMADAYNDRNEPKVYIDYANKYIAAIDAKGADATDAEEGLAAYYQGKVLMLEGDADEAHLAFQRSTEQLMDNVKRADAYIVMAERDLDRGDRAAAVAAAEKSLAALPDEDWKRSQVADFYARAGEEEKAASLYETDLNAATTPRRKAEAVRELAEFHKRSGNAGDYARYAEMYRDVVTAPDFKPTPDEQGLGWYYQGEIEEAERDFAQAQLSYEKAAALLTDKDLVSDIFQKMADYQVIYGSREKAVEFTEKSAENRPVAEVFRRTGETLFRLGMPERAHEYFERSAKAANPNDDASAFSIMADAYRDLGDEEQSIRYARLYVEAVAARLNDASDAEKGLAAYYQARIFAHEGAMDEAYQWYERASRYLADQPKRAEAYILMADDNANRGERELAAANAEKSLALFPNEDWKIRQVADLYHRIEMPEKADSLLHSRVEKAATPRQRAAAVREMAEFYRANDGEKAYLQLAGEYRDIVNAPDFAATPDEQGLAAYYEGEILMAEKDYEEAYKSYEEASELLADDALLSDAYQKMAEYQAEHGDLAKAAELSEKSASVRPEDWVFRRTGDFLLTIDMPDKAFTYIDRSVKMTNPDDNATAYAVMADALSGRNVPELYNKYANRFVAAVDAKENATRGELGLAAYYRGKILTAEKKPAEAYAWYEKAVRQLTDKPKLAEIYIEMAEYNAERGERALAAAQAEKSLAQLPDESWKARQVADFYYRVEMREKADSVMKANIDRAGTPRQKALAVREMAEFSRTNDDREAYMRYAGDYREIVNAKDFNPTANEQGLSLYYQGEILMDAGYYEGAYQAYKNASERLADPVLLSDAYQKMAEYEAEYGDEDKAVELAEKAADTRPEDFILRRTGDFFVTLNMPEKAHEYYDRSVKITDPKDDATAYSIITDAYADREEPEIYSRYANRYIAAIDAKGDRATDVEKGLAAYYRGRMLTNDEKPGEAYTWYEIASNLLEDMPKLADAYIQMAQYDIERGDRTRAVLLAEKSLAALPNEEWKRRQVADIYVDIDEQEKAVDLYATNLERADTPRRKAAAIREMAELYNRMGNQAEYLRYARLYRDTVMAPDFNPTADEQGLEWYYLAEIQHANKDLANARQSYEYATYLVTEPDLVSDIFHKMAQYEADRGNWAMAADFAERSADKRPVDWAYRRTGDILLRAHMPEKALLYYMRSVRLAHPDDDATAYAIMSDAYLALGNLKQSTRYAQLYVDAIAARSDNAPDLEKGMAAYYQGRIHTNREEPDVAFPCYVTATAHPLDETRLADAYTIMANHMLDKGEYDRAAIYAEKSLEQFPDADWKIRQTADFLYRIGRRDRAIALMWMQIEKAGTQRQKAAAVRELAELYKDRGDPDRYIEYATSYRQIVLAPGFDPTPNEQGLALYYQGEIRWADQEFPEAYSYYIQATQLLTDNNMQSDVIHKMAEYEASYGDKFLAAELAKKAAEKRPEGWVFRRCATLLVNVEMPEEGFDWFARSARMDNPEDDWSAYSYMAEVYYHMNRKDDLIFWGSQYADRIAAREDEATKNERGFAAYYRGKELTVGDLPEDGHNSYELASTLLTDKNKLFEVYGLLAEYHYDHYDRRDVSVEYIEKAYRLLPGDDSKVIQTAALYVRVDILDKAKELYNKRIHEAETPRIRAKKLRDFAEYLNHLWRKGEYVQVAAMYRDLIFSPGFNPTENERGLACYYQGEIYNEEQKCLEMHNAYVSATRSLKEKPLLSDVYMKLAEYEEKVGDKRVAANYAEIAAALRPEDWVLRRTADFLLKLDMQEKALDYYDRFVKKDHPEDDVSKYGLMADRYRGEGDFPMFVCYAGKYVNAVLAMGDQADDAKKAISGFYRGLLLDDEGEYFEGYRWYDWASYYLEDQSKLCEAYRIMAQYKMETGDYELAAKHIEKALNVFPDEPWLLNHVAGFYVDLGRPQVGICHLKNFIARDRDPRYLAAAYVYLAEIYRRIDHITEFVEWAYKYSCSIPLPKYRPKPDELGESVYYQGEAEGAMDRPDEAFCYYRKSLPYFTCPNKQRLSDVALRTAEHHARYERVRLATKYADLCAAYLPTNIGKMIELGNFFMHLDEFEKMHEYFNRARDLAKTPQDRARVWEALANFYKSQTDSIRYIRYANLYIDAVKERGKKATLREQGFSHYFRGEIHVELKRYAEAYKEYEKAIELFRDPDMLSTVYYRLAKINIKWGKNDLAAEQVLAGVELLPKRRWKVAEAMGLLADAGHFREAEEIAHMAIYLDPDNKYLYQSLARIYFDKIGNRKVASAYHKMFIDHLYDKREHRNNKVSKGEYEELWYARGAQNGIDRTWGLESTFGLTRWNTGDYWTGMSHQLYRNYHLRNGWFGKIYFQYGGSLASQFTSYHWIDDQTRQTNRSGSNLWDTGYLLVGATVHPFQQRWLRGIEFWAEKYIPLGKDGNDDTRVGVKYQHSEGDSNRPFGNLWKYWKAESNTWYSLKSREVTSIGELRRGFTYVNDCDRNLLFTPYGFVSYLYDGGNKDYPWGSDVGVALMIKKYFREDRYHLPRSTIELNVGYRWALTEGRDPALSVTLTTNF